MQKYQVLKVGILYMIHKCMAIILITVTEWFNVMQVLRNIYKIYQYQMISFCISLNVNNA